MAEEKVDQSSKGFEAALILYGLPSMKKAEKQASFKQWLVSEVEKYGKIVEYTSDKKLEEIDRKVFFMGSSKSKDGGRKIKSYAMFLMDTPSSAKKVIQAFHLAQFDQLKGKKLHCWSYTDFDRYKEKLEFVDKFITPPRLHSYLKDERARDHLVVRSGASTLTVRRYDPILGHETVTEDKNCAGWTQWSPMGTYLAIFNSWEFDAVSRTKHEVTSVFGNDILPAEYFSCASATIGGIVDGKIVKLFQLNHPGVQQILFSPDEKYVISMSGLFQSNELQLQERMDSLLPNRKGRVDDPGIRVWDVENRVEIAAFDVKWTAREVDRVRLAKGKARNVCQWSANSQYFSRLDEKKHIFWYFDIEKILSNKEYKGDKLPISAALDYYWAPSAHHNPFIAGSDYPKVGSSVICFTAPPHKHKPPRCGLISIPSGRSLSEKQIAAQNVEKMTISWHPDGSFCAVYSTMKGKNDRLVGTQVEFFNLRDPSFPSITKIYKDHVLQEIRWECAWSTTFAAIGRIAITGNEKYPDKSADVIFSKVDGSRIKDLFTLNKKKCNEIYWSPRGRYCVLMNTKQGRMEFLDIRTKSNPVFKETELYNANYGSWDPSGRYFIATTVRDLPNFINSRLEYLLAKQIDSVHGKQRAPTGRYSSLLSGHTEIVMYDIYGGVLENAKQNINNATDGPFLQLLWRPRPIFTSIAQRKDISNKLSKKYASKFSAQDKKLSHQQMEADQKERLAKKDSWSKFQRRTNKEAKEANEERKAKLEELKDYGEMYSDKYFEYFDYMADVSYEQIPDSEFVEIEFEEEVIVG